MHFAVWEHIEKEKMLYKEENILRDFFEGIGRIFDKKCTEQESFEIAGHTFWMEFEDRRMKEYFVWQMKLFRKKTTAYYGRIRIAADEKAGELAELKSRMKQFPNSVQTTFGKVTFHVFGMGGRIGKLLFAWCGDTRTGWVLIEPDQLEVFYQLSFMLTPLFSKMAPDIGMTLIHGGGVGVNGTGVILAGLSGAGKSSLASACLMSGMQYVSDDTMFLGLQDNLAYPMCSTIHLAPKILQIFQDISGQEFATKNGRGEKRHLDISFLENQFVQGLPMKAVIALKIDENAEFGIRPMKWDKAVVPLVYSSAHLLGEAQNVQAVKNVLGCLRKLPAYEFCMSGNLRYNAEYLKKFIMENI